MLEEEQKVANAAKAEYEAARAARIAEQEKEAKEAAEAELNSGGKGTYMQHDAEVSLSTCSFSSQLILCAYVLPQWYRKWQFRKEYSDNRDKRYVSTLVKAKPFPNSLGRKQSLTIS